VAYLFVQGVGISGGCPCVVEALV